MAERVESTPDIDEGVLNMIATLSGRGPVGVSLDEITVESAPPFDAIWTKTDNHIEESPIAPPSNV